MYIRHVIILYEGTYVEKITQKAKRKRRRKKPVCSIWRKTSAQQKPLALPSWSGIEVDVGQTDRHTHTYTQTQTHDAHCTLLFSKFSGKNRFK